MKHLDEVRVGRFLAELRKSGNAINASAAAPPTCTGPRAGYSTFLDLRRRHPAFREAWEGALNERRVLQRRLQRLTLEVLDDV